MNLLIYENELVYGTEATKSDYTNRKTSDNLLIYENL